MRGNPHSYQSIAAWIPDPPEYFEDSEGDTITCGDGQCDDWSVAFYGETPMCVKHYRHALEWDRADDANDERWIDESANI